MGQTSYLLKINNKIERVEFPYEHDTENKEWNAIAREQFLSVKEIAQNEFDRAQSDAINTIRNTPKKDLIMFHHGYGTWIRNNYALWHPNNPFVIKDNLGDNHPDGLSMLAIEALHDLCTDQNNAFDDAMNIIQEK